ncbi:SDR family oxidoreductase [Phytohabitans sp. ZYX-F-186]|uniref:SDR family oxidoreductase n=1 Tax=Phytohabitans maris TaxID=3071409 RepID=A0ABU0ZGQ3_9ACTN|nr:SDR family oxidoreductase [Phytohabitans sp. ZYX-F-186]MDQ7905107.1 SDR family oxidoreductase [Phytohabitans sp. ZYX-F-186]
MCSAGIEAGTPTHELTLEMWNNVIATNLTGTFLACREAIKAFRRAKRPGSIVCISSPWSFVAPRRGAAAAYASSKGGISSFVRALAVEYASAGIRVNAVTPGATETPLMWANVTGDQIEAVRTQIEREVPVGRLASAAEPAAAILWLLSSAAGYVTGANLTCDGGALATGVLTV